MEDQTARLSPASNMQWLRRQLQPGTLRQQLEEVGVQEIVSQAEGSSLVGIMGLLPGALVTLLGLLTVGLMDNEGDETSCAWHVVTDVRLVHPVPQVQKIAGTWQGGVDSSSVGTLASALVVRGHGPAGSETGSVA